MGAGQLEEPRSSPQLTKANMENETLVTCNPESQLTKEEEIQVGNVTWRLVWDYVSVSKGIFLFSLSVISQLAFATLQAAQLIG